MVKEKVLSRKIIAIISAIVIVSVAFGSIGYIELEKKIEKKPTLRLGPKIRVQSFASSNITNGVETVQIFSPVPEIFENNNISMYNVSSNAYNNSAYIELLNNSFNISGSSSFNNITNKSVFLSSNFSEINSMWINYLSNEIGSTEVSLNLIASLITQSNGTTYEYTYYNNILFNPFNIQYYTYNGSNSSWFNNTNINPIGYSEITYPNTAFSVNVYFDLNNPVGRFISTQEELNSFADTRKGTVTSDGIPGIPYVYYDPVNVTPKEGPLPLIGAHINTNSTSYLSLGGAFVSGSATLHMNSNMEVYSTSTNSYKDLMSTTPSLNETAPFYFPGNSGSVFPPNFVNGMLSETSGIIYMANTTYTIVHYNIYIDYKYSGNATEVEISNIATANHGFTVECMNVPLVFNYVIQNISGSSIEVGSLAPNNTLNSWDIQDVEQGYTNAANVYKSLVAGLDTFSASMDLGLALIDTLSAIDTLGDVALPIIVARSLTLIADLAAFSAKYLSDFSSISFISTTSITGFSTWITNYPLPGVQNGETFSIYDYQSTHEVSFYDPQNGQTYYFEAPMNYCIASTS